MVCGNANDRKNGRTVDGQHPLCMCQCPPPPGKFVFKYPKPPPCIICEKICPPVEPRPGEYWAPRPKNFMIKKYSCKYNPPKICTRPCCKHVKPKGSCCVYDDPCYASCVDHPIGMKASGRYPPMVYRGPMQKETCVPQE